jgi:hypothetical protein
MKRLHTFGLGDNVQLALLKDFLESNSIVCVSRSEHMFAAAGGVPITECYPELWIVKDEQFLSASHLLRVWTDSINRPTQEWECQNCNETCEGQFDVCWSCNTPRLIQEE